MPWIRQHVRRPAELSPNGSSKCRTSFGSISTAFGSTRNTR
jgi:hypothetical protein